MQNWVFAMALAAAVAQPQPAVDLAREQEARQIEMLLIAPCCWKRPVAEHGSAESNEVKRQIRVLLGEGRTRQQVLDAFAAQYGPRILAEPPAAGAGWLLYVGLPLAFVASAAGLVVFLRRASRKRPPPPLATGSGSEEEAAYGARLDDELRDLD